MKRWGDMTLLISSSASQHELLFNSPQMYWTSQPYSKYLILAWPYCKSKKNLNMFCRLWARHPLRSTKPHLAPKNGGCIWSPHPMESGRPSLSTCSMRMMRLNLAKGWAGPSIPNTLSSQPQCLLSQIPIHTKTATRLLVRESWSKVHLDANKGPFIFSYWDN